MKSNISRQFPNIVQRFFVGGVPDASRGLRDCYKKSGPQIQQSPPRQLGPALQGHFVGVHWKSILRSTTPVTFWTEPAGSIWKSPSPVYTVTQCMHQIIMQTQWPTNLGQLGHVGFSPATWDGAPSDSGPGHLSRRTFCWCTREMAWPEVSTAIPENWEQCSTLKRQRTMTNERTMTKRSKMQKVNKCISKIKIYACIL